MGKKRQGWQAGIRVRQVLVSINRDTPALRSGCRSLVVLPMVLVAALFMTVCVVSHAAAEEVQAVSYDEFLRGAAVPREVIDNFLAGPAWARFDPELGYTLGSFLPRDGIDGSRTISTVQANGARTSHMYNDRPCRINTYGDSFTQCHQVSDGETWQEYLAGHLGEPIRNFGMGGYGVYQAYRRMTREETSAHAARYVVFYIWGDDHHRSLLRCRHALTYRAWANARGRAFHNNFWPNMEMDLATGTIEEKENRLPTRESLYQMTDADRMVELLRDDLALQLMAFRQGWVRDLPRERVDLLAGHLGVKLDWSGSADLRGQISALLDAYAVRATCQVLTRVVEFTKKHDKRLLVVLFDPNRVLPALRDGQPRFDQPVVEFLKQNDVHYFDMNLVQLADFQRQRLPYDEYRQQYFIGHYNPRGNHFFAYAIKDRFVEWLEPKPVTYRDDQQDLIQFDGYLPSDEGDR